jgi:hypothetical protein
MHRSAAELRDAVRTEDAIRHAAQAAVERLTGVEATAAASGKASALKTAADSAAPRLVELRHGLWCHEGSSELVEAEPRPAREHPRRTRGP